MSHRHDAGYAAARIATFVRELAADIGPPQVATVGRLELHPNLVNVVASTATLTVDLRHTVESTLQEAEQRLATLCAELAEREGVTIEATTLARFEPVAFDPDMIDLVEATARRLGHSVRRMPSGAGHDAQMLARVCPTSMIFTPSVGGISHNPSELTHPTDLENGADVLLQVLLELAEVVGSAP
jgi:N-carbamoyl-L-amino-acid hydrolase